jgi:hypothetical protein
MRTLLKVLKIVAINVVVFGTLFALLEGAASLLFIGNQVRRASALRERQHSTYDESIGWVSLPNVTLPNLYGPGIFLRTNGQGFRADHDITPEVPAGKTRIICSGDSFTLGFGVTNDQTWCQRLGALDARLEAVNLGQGGYGLDQAYLWYKRAAAPLDHQVQLLSFITDDFRRMQSDRFLGYGRPVLGIRADSIVVLNKPVPQTSAFSRWKATQDHAIGNLNVVRLYNRVFHRGEEGPPADTVKARDDASRRIAAAIFADLARVNRSKKSQLVLVYLPGQSDYKTNGLAAEWRRFVGEEAAKQGVVFIDLIETIRHVPPTELDAFYLPDSHYSVEGNAWVASAVYKELARVLNLTPPLAAP